MKPTLTIGIFAYNEAANIGVLLAALASQKNDSADVSEILVVSDASTDQSANKVKKTICTQKSNLLI